MSARSFRPVISVATVAIAALSCYLISLRVAAERAGLEEVENSIVLAQRDIRTLQTEIGTRGRLEQLERWNVKVLALSAPKAEQFVDGGYQLARLARPSDEVDMTAPVVLASVPKPEPAQPINDGNDSAAKGRGAVSAPRNAAANLMHVASYSVAVKSISSRVRDPGSSDTVNPSKSGQNLSGTTKPLKIATASKRAPLPPGPHDAKTTVHSAATKATKDKATH